jgi:hypothetical protein
MPHSRASSLPTLRKTESAQCAPRRRDS